MAVRKNAASMSPPEITKFINALLALKKEPTVTPSGTATNIYDQFVAIHQGVVDRGSGSARGNGAHNGPAFCSWHREYILRFEKALQDISGDPNMFLPYWSWESGNASDTNSIFVDTFMGPRERITSGFFAEVPDPNVNPDGWRVDPRLDGVPFGRTSGSGTTLTRNSFTVSNTTATDGRDSITKTTFAGSNRFRSSLEGAHNSIHGTMGGHMLAMTSPNDPIFFMHHANVDRLWAKWQLTHPGDSNYPTTGNSGHALNDLMWPWDGGASSTNSARAQPFMPPVDTTDLRRPRDVLDIEALNYTYDDTVGSSGWPPAIPPPTTARLEPPTSFVAQNPTTNSIELVWGPQLTGSLSHTEYIIERRVQNSTGNPVVIIRPGTDTSYPDTGLQSNTTYDYLIKSSDGVGGVSTNTRSASETTGRCFVVTATYGTELAPQAQFAHEFYFDVVRKSKLKKPFDKFIQTYFKVSPPIANLMYRSKPFKYFMKYTVVIPFLAFSRVAAFLVGLKKNWDDKIE